jgi:hypothetical protein
MAAPVALLRHRIKLNHTRKEGRKKERKEKPHKAHQDLSFFFTAVWRALTQGN